MNQIENYIMTKELDLNLAEIEDSCRHLRKLVFEKLNPNKDINSRRLFKNYNLFLYPYPGFYELFTEIQIAFNEALKISGRENNGPYYIGCWVNFYGKDNFVPWHGHWPTELKTWHGFYCVNCEPSKTTYKLPGEKIVDIESKNNRLVISPSDGDQHRTWPWEHSDRDRITIAFDIVPWNTIYIPEWLNHWIPL